MSDKKGSTSNHGLNLNIPPPRVANHIPDSPTRLPIAPPTSPSSSCVSSELSQDDNSSSSSNKINNCGCTQSPEDISMVLVGCSRCIMYMMVNEGDYNTVMVVQMSTVAVVVAILMTIVVLGRMVVVA
ncbi:hypothetical protein JHK84_027471 [Glycine max]|nr:hypothetical protein JHK86_027361 [Glycine max]KAG5150999.1 hypothetical protein JHK84_027471 [Glycine max]